MAVKFPRLQASSIARWAIAAGVCLALAAATGCGMVAAPQPPSLKLPQPATDLIAQRIGNAVNLHWTMPKRATDKVLLGGGQRVEVCRRMEMGPCATVGRLVLAPEVQAAFTDVLPPALTSGPVRPLVYVVELQNHAGRSAGPSNAAVSAAGAAPAKIVGLEARATADGIVLSWKPEGGLETVRIRRTLVEKAGAKRSAAGVAAVPAEQTLEFTGEDQGRALDADAALDHIYTYVVQRVAKVTVDGRTVEMDGAPSEPVAINARDVFPPAVPKGLEAVADAEAHAIDLSWQADMDAAGYVVYRREAGSDEIVKMARVAEPSYRDTTAVVGNAYKYSISAVDQDGNESARCAEVEETLPAQ